VSLMVGQTPLRRQPLLAGGRLVRKYPVEIVDHPLTFCGKNLFIETDAFRNILHGNQTLVIEPKGSGKSAILATLVQNVDSNYTVVITPERFHKALLKDILESDAKIGSDIHAFSAAWMHTILMEVYKQVLQNRRGLRTGALAKIHSYVRDRAADADLDLLSRFVGFCRRIEGIKLGSYDISFKMRELESAFKLEDLLGLLPALESAVSGRTFFVLIDELDQGWDNTPLANSFLVSLLLTAIKLHSYKTGIRVIAFLRTEIFDILKTFFDQLDKMRGSMQFLRWSRNALAGLVAARVAFSLEFPKRYLEPLSAVGALFPEAPVRFSGDGFAYLLSRTSLRPREVIQFARLAYHEALNEDVSRISATALSHAEEEFSRWRFEHLCSEYLHIYPDLSSLLERFRHGMRLLPYNDAIDTIVAHILELSESETAPEWLRTRSEHEVGRLLFEIGFWGFRDQSAGGMLQGHHSSQDDFVYLYTRPSARLRQGSDLLIHPGFWKYLELQA
jgi:hypothetical protein